MNVIGGGLVLVNVDSMEAIASAALVEERAER
jgi:hypothetical protein